MNDTTRFGSFLAFLKNHVHFGPDEHTLELRKKARFSGLVFLLVALVSVGALAHERNVKQTARDAADNPQAKIVLYYSNSCPHCKNVEKFIADNGIRAKVDFAQKEVSSNPLNAQEMVKKAELCNQTSGTLGVPFLWDGENGDKCLMGDENIIEYFKIKANLQ